MTFHMNRRLEVLAKEIAAKKASPFDSTALNDWFRTNKSVKLPNGTSTFITEADCRQIKGAAQASNSAEKAGTTRPSPVAAPPSKPVWIGFDMAIKGSDQTAIAEYSVAGNTITIQPSPPTPVEVEWIPHKPGDPCPIPGVRSFVARFDRKFNGTTDEVRRHSLALDYWSAQGFGRKVVAYKLLPC